MVFEQLMWKLLTVWYCVRPINTHFTDPFIQSEREILVTELQVLSLKIFGAKTASI